MININAQITQLSNGLKLVSLPMSGTDTATVLLMFATGSRFESREQNGLSHFLEHMFFKGSTKRPSTMALTSDLDNLGAQFNAFTGKEFTGYWVKTSAANLEQAVDILSDMLINPLLDAEEIEREKGVICEEINMYNDNPMWLIEDVFEELLYGDTPAGWNTAGTKERVLSFDRQHFLDYWRQQYGSDAAFLVVAGKLPADLPALAERYFAALPASAWHNQPPTVEAQAEPAVKLQFKETDQAHLSLGVRTFGYAHADEHIIKLMSLILGGSMSSRLFIQLRERQGLAYYVRAEQEAHTDSGYLTTRAGVPTDKLEQAVKIILAEYRRLRDEPVSQEELQRAKNLLKGRLPLSLESSDEVAEWYAGQLTLLSEQTSPRRSALSPDELLAAIDQVTVEQIQRLAQEIFVPAGLNLAVIGPYKDEAPWRQLLTL